jgi:hypothetical protein
MRTEAPEVVVSVLETTHDEDKYLQMYHHKKNLTFLSLFLSCLIFQPSLLFLGRLCEPQNVSQYTTLQASRRLTHGHKLPVGL